MLSDLLFIKILKAFANTSLSNIYNVIRKRPINTRSLQLPIFIAK